MLLFQKLLRTHEMNDFKYIHLFCQWKKMPLLYEASTVLMADVNLLKMFKVDNED